MNITTDSPCPHGPWPARECDRCVPPEPARYAAPALILGGITALGYVALGAFCLLMGRLAWAAARAVVGGGS